ncbi:efflux RND transporter periplasmic adaptor subunit [candidate division KSB1 bacterium]|nr:efflux RND transporter periplasmic adaptor subunit [candidate division KSB1 bacterium]
MRKVIFIPLAILLLGAGGYYLWPKKSVPDQAAAPGMQQRTFTVQRGDLNAMVSATGKIQPIDQVEVKSKASGQIMVMPVEEGDLIEKGDLIARIDETDARNTYEQAVADLDVANATVAQTAGNVKRQEEMFKRGLLSEAEMDQVRLEEVRAKAQLVKAETEVATMDVRLKDSVVRSPISGVVLQKNVEAGQIISSGINSVSGGTLIATVARMDSMYVYAEVDEVDIGQVQIGQTAKVIPDAFPEEVFWGSVLRISPLAKVEQNVTTFNVTVIVSNASRKLKAGMNATVDLTVADKHGVLLIAKEALKDLREVRAQLLALNAADSSSGERRTGMPADSSRASRPARMADSGSMGNGQGGARFGLGDEMRISNGAAARKFVLVKSANGYHPRPVEIGVGNLDYAEVVSGLEEGETVVVFSSSRAAADRQAFMNRMRGMNSFGGFSGSGQRPSGR